MNNMEVFKDYVDLTSKSRIYEYIARNELEYWYDCAKDDNYDQYLIGLAEKYGIEIDYNAWEQDNIREEIYELEDELWNKLRNMVIGMIGGV